MNFKRDALNMWRRKKRRKLRVKWEELPEGTTSNQRDAKSAAAEELLLLLQPLAVEFRSVLSRWLDQLTIEKLVEIGFHP